MAVASASVSVEVKNSSRKLLPTPKIGVLSLFFGIRDQSDGTLTAAPAVLAIWRADSVTVTVTLPAVTELAP